MARVVIIDRFRVVAHAISESLGRRDGYEVAGVFYDDSPSTVTAAQGLRPDIVLVEVTTGGVDLIRRVRQALPRVHIIATTAHGDAKEAGLARSAGADDYLEKNHSSDRLIEAVQRPIRRT